MSADVTWILACSVLVMLMQAGFLFLEAGLTRSRNSINVALKHLTDLGVSFVAFWLVGFGLAFGASFGGLFGTDRLLFDFVGRQPFEIALFVFQAMFCGTAVTIVSGAVAGRLRYSWFVALTVVMSAVLYPLAIHAMWNADGWLARLGFVDFAGSTAVHSVGGWAALALILLLGPRAGRFDGDVPFNGSSIPSATLGAILLWVGWIGFNGGSLLAFDARVVPIIAVTVMAGAVGLVVSLAISWTINGQTRVHDPINGLLAGLVAVTASAHLVSAVEAVVIAAAGAGIAMAVERLLVARRIDDAVGAVPVHLGAGVWGTLAVAFVADGEQLGTGHGFVAQLGIQFVGVAATGALVFGAVGVIASVGGRRWPIRVSAEAERVGLNVAEHGAATDLVELVRLLDEQAPVSPASGSPAVTSSETEQIAGHYNRLAVALSDSEYIASVDPLTRLVNRRGFGRSLESLSAQECTVVMFDLCRFGSINGSYGHAAGDEVLVAVAQHLQTRLGPDWTLGRWGGDEFIAVAAGRPEVDPAVLEPITCHLSIGRPAEISVRAGVVQTIGDGAAAPDVIRRASYALDDAKRSGETLVWFDHRLANRQSRAEELAASNGDALETTRLVVVGQTVADAAGGVVGVELLVRWREEDGTLAAPSEIIPIFVEAGRMYDLDLHMLRMAATYVERLGVDGSDIQWVSVNISPSTFTSTTFLDDVRSAVSARNLDPSRLVLEITETEPDGTAVDWQANAHALRSLGVGLAIDDFGSGYSNIERVATLPITHLKLDREIVRSAHGPFREVVRALVRLAQEVGVITIAEAVENAEQASDMTELGIDLIQGFYLHRPEPIENIVGTVRHASADCNAGGRRSVGAVGTRS
ncbi:MAG: EAL domain-containing protein [Ilumatobacter sp.]